MQISEKTNVRLTLPTSANESRKRGNGRSNYLTVVRHPLEDNDLCVRHSMYQKKRGTSRLDNASNLRLYQSVELPKSRIWFRQIGDYENVEDRGITGPTPKTISQSQTFISSPPILWYAKKQKSSQSITESKRHRPASKQ
jgi:hypothetical protein